MKNNYTILWGDMHSNLHHKDIEKLTKWAEEMRNCFDFWPVVYYPYYMRKENGLGIEDRYDDGIIEQDWEDIRKVTNQLNAEGYPMFMAYEWQGSGEDGDHNVFLLDNFQNMAYPMRYDELEKSYHDIDAIAIPHHTAYQLDHRGKNWQTQNDRFSPFAEIFSSHGSSETDAGCIPMERHTHMGPRTDANTLESGWKTGHQFGVIASGDNHNYPGVFGHGYAAVLAEGHSKKDIWDAWNSRRVYGVSRERIQLQMELDGHPMGSVIPANKNAQLELGIVGDNAIDRIEILKDDIVSEMIPHTSTWEYQLLHGCVRFKFELQLGWGPDSRLFPECEKRVWNGSLSTVGKLISVEKCWSDFGQSLHDVTENSCEFTVTTHDAGAGDRWMRSGSSSAQGFIFEIEDDIDSSVTLCVDGMTYVFPIREILEQSRIIPLLDEAKEMLSKKYNFTEYYRSDPWWHNCYKIKVCRAVPQAAYTRTIVRTLDTTDCSRLRVRIWQRNGSTAWSSPIFIEGEKNRV